MYWINEMQSAVNYIEDRILSDLPVDDIAKSANSSVSNFQKIFSIVTGMAVGDYIRNRRLTLAGKELACGNFKILDIALKYGYETAESFTKAFTCFHGITPSAARKSETELKAFLPLSIKIDVRGGFNMQRKLIANVPVINYYGNNAALFITLLKAALHGLGEGEGCDIAKLTALSGEGNRFCWTDGEWVFGNEITQSINETPFETESRALKAIGWRAKYITVQRESDGSYMNTDAMQIRRDFVSAIDRGYPVLIRYTEHADSDINVFFGYEDDGAKIIGYAYGNEFEPGVSLPEDADIPIAWENWEDTIAGYILLQGKEEGASEKSAALSAFRQISRHSRKTDEIRGKKVGFAAWESYLYHLEHDDFSDLPFEEVKNRFFIYCDGLCQIYARKQALPYYQSLSEQFPQWRAELEIAVENLDACAAYGGFLWSQGFKLNDIGFEKFKDSEARKILADAGREALRCDITAVEQFEKILAVEGFSEPC